MVRIPFSSSAIETPRILAGTACQPLLGPPSSLAGGTDSPRNPISTRQYPLTAYYVNPRSVFRQSWTLAPAGARGFYINWLMPCEHEFVQEDEAEEFAEALKNEIKEHGE